MCGLDMGIWLVLPFLWGIVLGPDEGFVDVVGHQQVDLASVLVPLDGEATILFVVPIT